MPLSRKKQTLYTSGLQSLLLVLGTFHQKKLEESFLGHMKDHIGGQLKNCTEFSQVKKLIDDSIDYYNNERYQWNPAKLLPNEFYQFYMTGEYPIEIPNPPPAPQNAKDPQILGSESSKKDS